MNRPDIPTNLRSVVLYKSARTCCVCRDPSRRTQIHHIDQNRRNNVEANLALLCAHCHDEAHTKHDLSQNLIPEDIRRSKAQWEQEIADRSASSMLPSGNAQQALWTYFNHQRLREFLSREQIEYEGENIRKLTKVGAIDKYGIIQPMELPSPSNHTWTVYDYLPHHLCFSVRQLYAEVVDQLITRVPPLDLDAIWTRRQLKSLLHPGAYLFTLRGFHFRELEWNDSKRFATRLCYSSKRKIRIEFRVETRDMFGSSSVHDSFAGHRIAAALVCFKSFAEDDNELVLHCTPIAMGMGFLRGFRNSPYHREDGSIDGPLPCFGESGPP